MISVRDINLFKTIKSDWRDFKVERNKSEYFGKCGPNWLSINEREEYFDDLVNLMERWINQTQGVENGTDKSYGRPNN